MISEPFANLFQELLYHDVRENKAIILTKEILAIYFPDTHREPEFFITTAAFIEVGLKPTCLNEPWNQAACEIFCKQANFRWSLTESQDVLFVRGDLCYSHS